MSVISGKTGTLTADGVEEQHVTNIRLSKLSENKPYHDNTCGGSRKRVAGVKDCNGTLEMTDKPSFKEGYKRTLAIYTGQDIYTVDVIIDNIDVNTNIDGDIVGHTVAFSGDGTIAETTGSAP